MRNKWVGALLLLSSIAGCDGPKAPIDAHPQGHEHGEPRTGEDPSVEAKLPALVTIDPKLLSDGRITLVPVTSADAFGGRRVPGEVVSAPDGAAEISSLVGGRIASLQVNVGDEVKKGQTLAWVESPEVGAARAELAGASAALEMEKARVTRQESLQAEGATSQAAIDTARAALGAARAAHLAATLRLRSFGASGGNDARLALTSPIDGLVTQRHAILGAAVHPGTLLFSVIAPGRVLVLARYPEGKNVTPEVGTSVTVMPRGAARSPACQATVETNTRVIDPHTRTILVRLRPKDDCAGLRPGAYVEVQADASSSPAPSERSAPVETKSTTLRIPEEAVVFVRDQTYVFVPSDTPGRFLVRGVRAQFSNDGSAIVSEGLKLGEQVVSGGTILLKGEMLQESLGGHDH